MACSKLSTICCVSRLSSAMAVETCFNLPTEDLSCSISSSSSKLVPASIATCMWSLWSEVAKRDCLALRPGLCVGGCWDGERRSGGRLKVRIEGRGAV